MTINSSAIADPVFALLSPSRAPPAITALYQESPPQVEVGGFRTSVSWLDTYVVEVLQLPTPTTDMSHGQLDTAVVAQQESRATTPAEHAIGEFRRWSQLAADWDGEGALAPAQNSLHEASAFTCLLSDEREVEPMLHATGRAGLYFRTAALYADLEFFGDGRVAYYIERNGDKHKGVVIFDKKEMPAVFETLLQS